MKAHRVCKIIAVATAISIFSGCFTPPTKTPMDVLTYEAKKGETQKYLFVLLRGMYGTNESFEKEGFIDAVRERGLPFDMVAPDAHFGYYRERNLEIRLKEDVIEPAKTKGYQKIWLVGVSMGGFGSMFYMRKFADDIDGVILISPFLTKDKIPNQIAKAGGLRKWGAGKYTDKEWKLLFWDWIKEYDRRRNELAPIYLGYGRSDRYRAGQEVLAQTLPPERLFAIDGDHSISTFKRLWDVMLDKVPFN